MFPPVVGHPPAQAYRLGSRAVLRLSGPAGACWGHLATGQALAHSTLVVYLVDCGSQVLAGTLVQTASPRKEP